MNLVHELSMHIKRRGILPSRGRRSSNSALSYDNEDSPCLFRAHNQQMPHRHHKQQQKQPHRQTYRQHDWLIPRYQKINPYTSELRMDHTQRTITMKNGSIQHDQSGMVEQDKGLNKSLANQTLDQQAEDSQCILIGSNNYSHTEEQKKYQQCSLKTQKDYEPSNFRVLITPVLPPKVSKVLQAIIGENDRSKPSFKVQLDKGEIVTIGNREMRLLYADELLDYYEMNIEWSQISQSRYTL